MTKKIMVNEDALKKWITDNTDEDKLKKRIMNQLYGQDAIVEFILGGMATFTVHNKIAKSQFTYRVKEASQDLFDDKPPYVVNVLDTENDTGNYYFLGWISPTSRRFVYGETSRIAQTAISVKTFRWLWSKLDETDPDLDELVILALD